MGWWGLDLSFLIELMLMINFLVLIRCGIVVLIKRKGVVRFICKVVF